MVLENTKQHRDISVVSPQGAPHCITSLVTPNKPQENFETLRRIVLVPEPRTEAE